MDKGNEENNVRLMDAVDEIYQNLDKQIDAAGLSCKVCGQCCDFDTFGHRLYITTPELFYFKNKLKENKVPVLPMADGVCPYRKDGKCSVYPWRFAGCRIFNCTGDADLQSCLSEEAIALCKTLCILYGMGYGYMDLKTALSQTAAQ
jgi:Fe-S-cluster containining protein